MGARRIGSVPWLACVAVLAPAAASQGGAPPRTIVCQGRTQRSEELPATVPETVRKAAARLEAWAGKHGLRIHVAPKDTLLVVVPSSSGALQGKLRSARTDLQRRLGRPAPEDALEVVLVESKPALGEYAALLAESEAYLRSWAPQQQEGVGFLLSRPFAAAYRFDDGEKSEARTENELLHRVGHLVAASVLGRQPHWVVEGIAWGAEQRGSGAIHAFCNRNGFVGRKEHAGWPRAGRARLLEGTELPLDAILAMDRGSEVGSDLGAAAMVLVEHLLAKETEAFARCLAEWSKELEAGAADPEFRIPAAKQRASLEAALGEGGLAKLRDAIRRS